MSLKTFFQGLGQDAATGWKNFLNWFGSEEAEVVADAKLLIDEVKPIFKADLVADGSLALTAVGTALKSGAEPLAAAEAGIAALAPQLIAQAISLSVQAKQFLSSILLSKAQALQQQAAKSSGSGSAAGVVATLASAGS